MDLKKEWKEAIETLKEVASDDFDTLGDDISPKMAQNILNLIDKQQKEIEEKSTIINQLLEDMKERANNFSFESEIMWRKIEKAEKLLEKK